MYLRVLNGDINHRNEVSGRLQNTNIYTIHIVSDMSRSFNINFYETNVGWVLREAMASLITIVEQVSYMY